MTLYRGYAVVKRSSSSLKSPLPEPKNGCFLAVSIATFQKINRSLAVPDGYWFLVLQFGSGSIGGFSSVITKSPLLCSMVGVGDKLLVEQV
jgi:hypothetical protein